MIAPSAPPITLQEAVNDLYNIVWVRGSKTSTVRLRTLANYCVQELALRGLHGAMAEDTITGWVRPKDWDVVLRTGGRVRLAISLKSMLRGLGGSTPNRTDDLMGEAADVQLRYPETVIGYIILMNEGEDSPPGPEGKWIAKYEDRLSRASQRRAPLWVNGLIEAGSVVRVDFTTGPVLRSSPNVLGPFFDRLVTEFRLRAT